MMGVDETLHGALITEAVANPAAGTGIVLRSFDGMRFRVFGLRCRLTTDANIANRRVTWAVWNGVLSGVVYMCFNSLPDGDSRVYDFIPRFGRVDYVGPIGCDVPFCLDIEFTYTNYLSISANGIQVGDQFSEISWTRMEWIDR
jgi:hypothetical protein